MKNIFILTIVLILISQIKSIFKNRCLINSVADIVDYTQSFKENGITVVQAFWKKFKKDEYLNYICVIWEKKR